MGRILVVSFELHAWVTRLFLLIVISGTYMFLLSDFLSGMRFVINLVKFKLNWGGGRIENPAPPLCGTPAGEQRMLTYYIFASLEF